MTFRLLIVDDSQPIREMIRAALAGAALIVGECEDGASALDAYARLKPDWVLMDVDMKLVDGITATRQIVAVYPDARVLIVSEHDDDELRKAALEAGARDYVTKEDLLSILEILKA